MWLSNTDNCHLSSYSTLNLSERSSCMSMTSSAFGDLAMLASCWHIVGTTIAYSFHVDACSSFFGETLFLPLFSCDSALSRLWQTFSIHSKQHIYSLIVTIFQTKSTCSKYGKLKLRCGACASYYF